MTDKTLTLLSAASLLHDLPHALQQSEIDSVQLIHILSPWIEHSFVGDMLAEYHLRTRKSQRNRGDRRIFEEIIRYAEHLSLAAQSKENGNVSPVKSIFSSIRNTTEANSIPDKFFHANELSLDTLFQVESSRKDILFAPSYQFNSFLDDLSTLCTTSAVPRINGVWSLMKKYFWAITLNHHGNDCNVSLYDHASITAAIAGNLYLFLNKHHREIFVSQNIDLIQDRITNQTEPRYCLVTLEVGSDPLSTQSSKCILQKKQALLHGVHTLLNSYGLFFSSVLFLGETKAILLLPNIDVAKIDTIIWKLNIAYRERSLDINIYHKKTIAADHDFVTHSSSSSTCQTFFMNALRISEGTHLNVGEDYLKAHYKKIFGPDHLSDLADSIDFCESSLAIETDAVDPLVFIGSGDDDNDTMTILNTSHQFDHHVSDLSAYVLSVNFSLKNNLTLIEKADPVFISFKHVRVQNALRFPYATITAIIPTADSGLPDDSNLTQLRHYFSLVSLFMIYGLADVIDKHDGSMVNYADGYSIRFTFSPESLARVIESCRMLIDTIIQQASVSFHIRIHTSSDQLSTVAKFRLDDTENKVFLFGSCMNLNEAYALFKNGAELLRIFSELPQDEQRTIAHQCKHALRKASYVQRINALPTLFDSYIYDFFNPILLIQWFYYSISKTLKGDCQ